MAITKGLLEEKGRPQVEWWIEPATSTHHEIRINELTNQDRFLTWAEFRQIVEQSGNPLAGRLLEEIETVMNSGQFCGRISVASLDHLRGGMPVEHFVHFLRVFIVGTLRHHVARHRVN